MTPVDPYGNRNGISRPAASPSNSPAESEISLSDLFATLLKGKWIILGSFLVVLVLVGLYTFTRAPLYEASSMLYINNESSTPQLSKALGLDLGKDDVDNDIELLRSRTIAQRVVERLMALGEVPSTGTPLTILTEGDGDGDRRTEAEMVELLREERVTISPRGRDIDMIDVRVRSPQPEEAALIANLYAEEYVAYNRREARQRFRLAAEFLAEQVAGLDTSLVDVEQGLVSFQNQSQVVAPELEAEQLFKQIGELQRLYYEAQVALRTAQSEIAGYEAELDRIRPGLASRIASVDDALISALKEQIARAQSELDRTYAQNPSARTQQPPPRDVQRLRDEISVLTERVNERSAQLARDVVEGSTLVLPGGPGGPAGSNTAFLQPVQELSGRLITRRIEAEGLQASLGVIQQSLRRFESEIAQLPGQSVALERFDRSRELVKEAYIEYQKQLLQARAAEQSEIGYVTIVDMAVVPDAKEPVTPRVPLNLLLGTVLGLMAGIGLALFRAALDNKIRRPEDLRRKGYAIMSVVPDMRRVIKLDFDGRERITVDGRSYSTSLITLLNPLSPIAEAYRKLRTNIQYSRPDAPIQVLGVTSPGPGEGKSVTAMNLAISVAQSGRRTAYVDADLRRPSGHKLMGVPREPGLTDLLFESSFGGFEAYATKTDSLHVITAGGRSSNPSELLGSRRMRDLIAHLRREFEFIIIDTSPVLAVTDAQIIGTMVDATLMVTSAAETTIQGLDRSAEALHDVGAEIVGVVLNRFDAQAAYGGYGSGYGYGYGYGEYGEQASGTPALT